jgi:pyrroline-5-carboxylate reductase
MPAVKAAKDARIGFIGLGDIGSLMAANMIKAGFELRVLDLRKDAVEQAVKLGARDAGSAKAMAAECPDIPWVRDRQLHIRTGILPARRPAYGVPVEIS